MFHCPPVECETLWLHSQPARQSRAGWNIKTPELIMTNNNPLTASHTERERECIFYRQKTVQQFKRDSWAQHKLLFNTLPSVMWLFQYFGAGIDWAKLYKSFNSLNQPSMTQCEPGYCIIFISWNNLGLASSHWSHYLDFLQKINLTSLGEKYLSEKKLTFT